jgi:hypothetical protein
MPEVKDPSILQRLQGTAATSTPPIATPGGVFLPAPGAEARENREEAREQRDRVSTGIQLEQEDRAGRTEERTVARDDREGMQGLRKEFDNLQPVKDYKLALPSFVAALKTSPDGAGDLALIYHFAKTVDPGSAVQQGEMDNISSTDARLPAAAQGFLRELQLSEGVFRDEVRDGIRRELLTVIGQKKRGYNYERGRFADIVNTSGYDPDLIIGKHFGEQYRDQIEQSWGGKPLPPGVGRRSALTPDGTATEPAVSGEAGAFMTPRDKELQDRLNAAYTAGASLADLNAIAAEYGTPAGLPATQVELDAARAQGRKIAVQPTGFRAEEVSALGIPADSAGGAFVMKAANGLLSGGMDELVGAMGGDAAMAEAAKQAIAERYPVASFAGDVAGQVMQAIPATRVLGAVGATGRGAQIASEVGQGAAYGAGESNEDRLLGGALGGGGAIAGRAIAERFIEPGVQAVMQKISRDTGVPVEEVRRVAEEAMTAASEPVTDETTQLARHAAGIGPKAKTARRKLAEVAAMDPEAAAAAQRLGVDLPPDVLSENVQLRNLAGLARSQVGSEAETGWQGAAGRASARVQGVLDEIGATGDLAQLSENVGKRIRTTMDDLGTQAGALRAEVDAVIDPKAPMDAAALRGRLAETIDQMGGRENLNPLETRLLRLIDDEKPPTYAYFNRIRDDIGQALEKGKGPFADIDQRTLGDYYAALKQDRLDFVRQAGGDELADKMAASNALYTQMYDARAELIDLFGKDLQGGIVPALRSVLTTGSKGDVGKLNRMLASVPEDMQGDVLLSGILAESMSKTGAQGGFSFTNFSKLYRGLQNNKPIIGKIGKAIGPERMQIMTDLYAVGRRIADAESRILRTGKANQAQLATLNADNFVSSFLRQWGVRQGANLAGVATGAMAGGPAGAAGAAAVGEVLANKLGGSTTRLDKLHRVLSSPQFRETVEKVAEGDTSPGVLNRLANSNAFVSFARATGLDTPEARKAWLESIVTSTGTVGAVQAGPESEPQPRIELVP